MVGWLRMLCARAETILMTFVDKSCTVLLARQDRCYGENLLCYLFWRLAISVRMLACKAVPGPNITF